MKQYIIGLACFFALAGSSAPNAAADNVLDTGVGRVDPGEVRVGLWRINYGLKGKLSRLQVGSATLPYLTWVIGLPTANLELKYEPWRNANWRTSIGVGASWFRFENEDVESSLFIVPLDARVAWHRGRFAFHSGLTANISSNNTKIDLDEFDTSAGFAGSTMYLPIGGYGQLGRRISFVVEHRFYLYQTFGLSGETEIDERTRARVYGEVGFNGRGMTTFDVLFHWRHVGLKIGVSSGDIEIPIFKVVVPAQTIFPRFDLYVRF